MRQSITYSYLTMISLQFLAILKMRLTPCILGNQGQMCCPTLSHKITQMEHSQGMPQTVMQATMTLNVQVSMMHYGRQLSLLPLQSNVIIFPFNLCLACYYKCRYCWDAQYNTCKQCKSGYYLLNNECLDNCPDGTYADQATSSCLTCPSKCSVCTGPDETTQCQKCKNPYFYLKDGCYKTCPKGYWGDVQTYYCKVCHSACTACTGPYSI